MSSPLSRLAGRLLTGPTAFFLAWLVDLIALAVDGARRRRRATGARARPRV